MRHFTGRIAFFRNSQFHGHRTPGRGIAGKWEVCKKSGRRRFLRKLLPEDVKCGNVAEKSVSEAVANLGERSEEMIRLEAFLFLSREPMPGKKLAQFLGTNNTHHVVDLIRDLNQSYDSDQRSFRILEFAGGYQYRVRPQFTPWLRRLCRHEHVDNQESPEIQLSPPAMETLAIIAYRQPTTRAEIESVRGVQCAELLRLLLEKNLIRIAGCSSDLGRPRLYGTTRKFLEVFGLKTLAQLPPLALD